MTGISAVIPAKAGTVPSTPMRLSLLTVIPAKAGIHRCSPIRCAVAPDPQIAGVVAVIPVQAGIHGPDYGRSRPVDG